MGAFQRKKNFSGLKLTSIGLNAWILPVNCVKRFYHGTNITTSWLGTFGGDPSGMDKKKPGLMAGLLKNIFSNLFSGNFAGVYQSTVRF